MGDGASDGELLERARRGEERAFRLLVERHEPAVAAVVIAMLGRGEEAEDVGQETFVRFYRSIDRFRGESALGTYLTRIAINLSLNALKRRNRLAARFLRQDEARAPATESEDEAERRERERLVRDAIARLDPKHRAVVVLRMMEGYSTKETAAILGIREGTVTSRLARAMRKLAKELEP